MNNDSYHNFYLSAALINWYTLIIDQLDMNHDKVLSIFIFTISLCNQERKDIFGRRDMVESLRFHPTLILLFLKQTVFYSKF